jgi:endoglucanase
MIKRFLCFTVISLFCSFTNTGYTQGFLKASGQQIVNEKGENVLLRGIGLGGWMLQEGYMLGLRNGPQQQHEIRNRIEKLLSKDQAQEFYDVWLANHTTRADVEALHRWGFNSIRLPMHYNLYTLPVEEEPVAGQHTWLKKGFALTDSLLAWCKANKIYLILDLHAAPGGQGNDLNIADRDPSRPALWESDANQQKTVALWTKLAQRYAKEPWIGGYDILNEPNWGFADTAQDKHGLKEAGNAPLKKLLVDITRAIRTVDKTHLIVIEGNGWGNNYKGMLPPWDDNMVLSFHKYWNPNNPQSIQHILDMRSKYNTPVWLGESGENSNPWFTSAIQLLEQNNIGWSWWPLKKLGNNNPLQIRNNHNYAALLAYWNGDRKNPPKESDVYSGLLELATYTNYATNIIHRDVIDAMIRQPHDNKALPFNSNVIRQGTTIQAVDYDLGRNGIAYYDLDSTNEHGPGGPGGNQGHVYRNDGVDIRKDSVGYEKYVVDQIQDGEWLQYTVTIKTAGNYQLTLSVAAGSGSGIIALRDGSKTLVANIPLPGDKPGWQDIAVTPVYLSAGKHALRIEAIKGGFELRSIGFAVKK